MSSETTLATNVAHNNAVTALISTLNDAQCQAVTTPAHSVLVLAGAGSGKTRVLVHRIAWQIQVMGTSMHSILAVTFTNKAAKEMRGRIEDLLQVSARAMWIGTFHGLAHRLLRSHAKQANLPDTFQVMDTSDQLRLIKRLLAGLNLDEDKWPPRQVQWYINGQKDEGIRAKHCVAGYDLYQQNQLKIYQAYEALCERSGLVDFGELLLRAHELLRDNPDVLAFYQQRFRHVLVDEFQDTNTVQYAWLRLLTQGRDDIFVVGDDDQSIYGWRGAKVENIFSFQKHYPDHQIIKLEQNYRSTGFILKAANAVVANNEGRMGKALWTASADGDPIALYAAFNEQDEAYFVVERIRSWLKDGGKHNDVAILYRSNAQSRQFEERLMTAAIPYRVYGGLRFFERAEIKNALAYLRMVTNRHDDASFERIINTPTRGIGAKTVDDIRQVARDQGISLWAAMLLCVEQGQLSARASNALASFAQLIKHLDQLAEDLELFEKVQLVVEKTGLLDFHSKEKADKGDEKVENLHELVNAARLFDFDSTLEGMENLSELDMFLAYASLEAGDMQADDFEDCVQLMTLHSAKGLEFKLVFLVGLEEGLFPSQQSLDDAGRLQEERRLCYVGITRAMQYLYVSYAESRRLYGRESYPRPSRFLREIPSECVQEVRLRAEVSRPVTAVKTYSAPLQAQGQYCLGQRVSHIKFGEGVILQTEGAGEQERVQINFKQAGIKWLMLAYAKLNAM
ncbi:DNA helicase II [Crenothrix polyspora]|uniref:DNA 3'-5' helicase n=1 Tax=Crenothrix polyspora TaxID=360316 RepID=A0A1R4H308_9GAMM|nr:DNA helicase II [Crenothrix polyspora]SJM90633.1 DNA-dependent ATPase I and helicase II [Crenothrix polyspora]